MDAGGIVLKVETLNLLFSGYGDQTIGLAFAIKPEATRNPSDLPEYAVNIDVYRCYWDTNSSDKKTIKAAKGSDAYIRTASDRAARLGQQVNERNPSQYEFEFKKLMQKKKFVFGFLTKDQYDILVKHKAKEIFISGAIIDFGTISSLAFRGQYFTFKVEPYEKDISYKWFMPETMGVPVTQILIPCPHEWANMAKNAYTDFWDNLLTAVEEASKL